MDQAIFELRPINTGDVGDLVRLTDEIDWRFTEKYWQIILATGRVFGLFDEQNKLAAISAIFDYGERLAALGVIIVREEYRGQGLASRVIDEAENSLGRTTTPVMLVATSDGKPVYEARGYKTISNCHKFIRPVSAEPFCPPSMPGYKFQSIKQKNLPEIEAFDKHAFCADRGHVLLAKIKEGQPALALLEESSGNIVGYGMMGSRQDMLVIGPIVAEKVNQAIALIQMLSYGRQNAIRVDALEHQGEFRQALTGMGFEEVEVSPVMMLGGTQEIIEQEKTRAIISQAFG